MTETGRRSLLAECEKRGISVQSHSFSNISIDGVSRHDAAEWLLERTFQKALSLLRKEFGACARFWPRPGDVGIDFYWRKARLAVTISGPLNRRRFCLDNHKVRDKIAGHRLAIAREFRFTDEKAVTQADVQELVLPYYIVWHNPRKFLAEIRTILINSGAYPRLRAAS